VTDYQFNYDSFYQSFNPFLLTPERLVHRDYGIVTSQNLPKFLYFDYGYIVDSTLCNQSKYKLERHIAVTSKQENFFFFFGVKNGLQILQFQSQILGRTIKANLS